jgi:hypothetical protein
MASVGVLGAFDIGSSMRSRRGKGTIFAKSKLERISHNMYYGKCLYQRLRRVLLSFPRVMLQAPKGREPLIVVVGQDYAGVDARIEK